ncbi:DUF3558 family protein [Actinophytocola sp.]|jgi:hypothetical protein|uniref:DUF3558 family protein n=1 Tax=Actinophytocola sp. TaxID=1872138 RepID=UPI002EDB8EE7
MRTLRIALASLLLVAGCSTAEPGQPTAGDPTTTTTPATTTGQPEETTTTTGAPVHRPKEIDLTAVDICKVVAKLPVRDYGLDGDRPPVGGDSSLFPGAKDCFAGGIQKNMSLTLIAVTDEGATSFVETANAEVSTAVAAGFPLSVLKPRQPANCFGVLDVHDGQFVFISYGLGSPTEQPVTPQNKLCQTLPTIATATIAALG